MTLNHRSTVILSIFLFLTGLLVIPSNSFYVNSVVHEKNANTPPQSAAATPTQFPQNCMQRIPVNGCSAKQIAYSNVTKRDLKLQWFKVKKFFLSIESY